MSGKIETFTIVVGSKKCNAHCPFCVSKMTGFEAVSCAPEIIDEDNLAKACRQAQIGEATTVLLSSKGEPTLFPEIITRYLELLLPWKFPFIELQTNALVIGRLARDDNSGVPGLTKETLMRWRKLGLNTIAISVVSERNKDNAQIYSPDYPDLATTIKFLHSLHFTVRLSVMMLKTFVCTIGRVKDVLQFCRDNKVEQVTVRPIRKPKKVTHNDKASDFVTKFGLEHDREMEIYRYFSNTPTIFVRFMDLMSSRFGPLPYPKRTKLRTLSHGAVVMDIDGQNLCLTDCLNETGEDANIRTLIFYSSGLLTYRWDYEGAIILGGNKD